MPKLVLQDLYASYRQIIGLRDHLLVSSPSFPRTGGDRNGNYTDEQRRKSGMKMSILIK